MPNNSPEYSRKWRRKNAERLRPLNAAKARRFRTLYPERCKEANRKSYLKHRKKYLAKDRERRIARKLIVLAKYGPDGKVQCSWPGCEIADPDMLSLDHRNNDGYQERKLLGDGARVYLRRIKEGFPPGYQTLCMNHQFKKRTMKNEALRASS